MRKRGGGVCVYVWDRRLRRTCNAGGCMNLHALFDPTRFAAAFGAVGAKSDDLDPSMIERCRGRTPNLAITAPVHDLLRRDHTDEDLRAAQFEQSAATRNGVVAPFPTGANQ